MAGNAELARVEAPVLLVAGELDQASPIAVNRENAERLPNAELVEIADCAHIIPWEKPDELLAAMLPFLRRALA
jgi:pimeloyl-ACP methyl ester carboxylesterase